MGTSVEFFFQPAGNGDLRADYLFGEDVVKPGGLRSMDESAGLWRPRSLLAAASSAPPTTAACTSTPASPTTRSISRSKAARTAPRGWRCRASAAANREQIEQVFYRAFTQMLPANATFALARAATIQAARDLYGANSAAGTRRHAGLDRRRRQLRTLLLSFALALSVAASATAQTTWSERVHISVNGAFQSTTNDFADRFEFERYLETGSTDVDYPVQGGFIFDAGAGYRLWKNLGVGVSVSVLHARRCGEHDDERSASVPFQPAA